MQPHDIAVGSGRGMHIGCQICQRHIDISSPALDRFCIECATHTPRRINRHYQVREAVIIERSVELVMVPTQGADKRVDAYRRKGRSERHHTIIQVRHKRISQIDGAASPADTRCLVAIKVDTCNHCRTVHLISRHQLLCVTRTHEGVRKLSVSTHHVGRVANKDHTTCLRTCHQREMQSHP